jgi:hypothetical protein
VCATTWAKESGGLGFGLGAGVGGLVLGEGEPVAMFSALCLIQAHEFRSRRAIIFLIFE